MLLQYVLVKHRDRERERDLFSDISMLSERHIAHRTDSQRRKKKKKHNNSDINTSMNALNSQLPITIFKQKCLNVAV